MVYINAINIQSTKEVLNIKKINLCLILKMADMGKDTNINKEKDIIPSIEKNAIFLNGDYFAYKVNRSELFRNLNKREACGSMTVLSARNENVMYMPMYLLPPEWTKKTCFYPAKKQPNKGELMYEPDGFISFAVVIAKTSLRQEYADIYKSVYADCDIADLSDSLIDSIEKHEETFGNINDYEEKQIDTDLLEDEISDNEVILLFINKTRFFLHGSTGAPFEFPRKNIIDLGNSEMHIPYTTASVFYGPIGNGDKEICKKAENKLTLKSSCTVIWDIMEFESISLSLPNVFESLREFAKFVYRLLIKSTYHNEDMEDSYESSTTMFAIKLRITLESLIDIKNQSSIANSYTFGDNVVCVHKLYLAMLLGEKTVMNCKYPSKCNALKDLCNFESPEQPTWLLLKQTVSHNSKTWSGFAFALTYLVMSKINKLKIHSIHQNVCSTCQSSICCIETCNKYCSNALKKDFSKKFNSQYDGIGYSMVGENNAAASFIGNTKREKMSNEEYAPIIAPQWIKAALNTVNRFENDITFTKNDEPAFFNTLFNKIEEVSRYIKDEKHGESLKSRFGNSLKLEAELKDSAKPSIAYMGTYYSVIRKSAVYRLMCIISMKYGKNLQLSMADKINKIVADKFHGYNNESKPIYRVLSPVDCIYVIPEQDSECGNKDITSVHKGQRKIGEVTINSSSKIKSIIARLTPSRNDVDIAIPDVMSFGQNLLSESSAFLSDPKFEKILEKLRIWIGFTVLPSLLNSKGIKANSYPTMKGGPAKKIKKIDRFLENHPDIFQSLSCVNEMTTINSWHDFLRIFVPFYMYYTYDYIPDVFKKDGRQRAIINPLTFAQMCWNEGEKDNPLHFDTTLLKPALLDCPAALVYTRMTITSYESKDKCNGIFQAKLCDFTQKTSSLLTDVVPSFSLMSNMVYAIPITKPMIWQSNSNINFLLDLFDKLRLADNPIDIINNNAEKIHEFMVYQLYGNSEDIALNVDMALEWLGNVDPNRTVLSNSLVYDMFVNVATNYKNDKEKYEKKTQRLNESITKIELQEIDDYSDEEEDEFKGIKRKHEFDESQSYAVDKHRMTSKYMHDDSQNDEGEWTDP